jgi:hypothetical protein
MPKESMLTTIDNPFNPFTQFEEWYSYDESMGYNTLGYFARIAMSSDELSEEDQALAEEAAISEIIKMNINGLYKRVTRDAVATSTTE